MSGHTWQRIVGVVLLALACSVVVGGRASGAALPKLLPRLPRPEPSDIPEFKSPGQPKPPIEETRRFKRADVSLGDIHRLHIPKERPLKLFATLSPANPVEPGKAVMAFLFPAMVNPLEPVASFGETTIAPGRPAPFEPTLVLGVQSEANKRFVFCVSVEVTAMPGLSFSVRGTDAKAVSVAPQGEFLILRLRTESDGWHPLYVTYPHRKAQWRVYGCTVGTH